MPGWHIDALCQHLEAVSRGEIGRLLVNLPPRHMKSLMVSVLWPAWVWTRAPETRFLSASYAQGLSVRDALRCRRLIESPWYGAHFGTGFRLLADQNQKGRYDNDRGGSRLATSVGGTATGEGGDTIVIDDPHKAEDAFSAAARARAARWWDETMATRINDPARSSVVIVMQRLHEEDLAGHVLAQGGFEHLVLAAEYEPGPRRTTGLGFADPRTEAGAPLWPERFPRQRLEEWKRRLGSAAAAGQLQQRPSPRGGGMVKLDWFRRYREPPPAPLRRVASWDTAFKTGLAHDYSAATLWAETAEGFYLLDAFRARLDYPALLRRVKSLAQEWRADAVLIEDKGSGQSLLQELKASTRLPAVAIGPRGEKRLRLAAASALIEAGRVFLPETAPWLADYEDEMAAFPNGAHDDFADTTSQYLNWAKRPGARPAVRVLG